MYIKRLLGERERAKRKIIYLSGVITVAIAVHIARTDTGQ